MIPVDQSRAVVIDPRHATQVVGDFAESVGLPRAESYSPAQACLLLGRLGYDCPLNTIREFTAKGYIGDPGDTWAPVNVYCLMAALEARRRWLRTPCVHDAKKTGVRLMLEQRLNEGINPPVDDLDSHSVEDLLLQLIGSDNRAERECLFEVLRLKLAGYEE